MENFNPNPEDVQRRVFQFKNDPHINSVMHYIGRLYDVAPKVIRIMSASAEEVNESLAGKRLLDSSTFISYELSESPMKARIEKMLSDLDKYRLNNYPDLFTKTDE